MAASISRFANERLADPGTLRAPPPGEISGYLAWARQQSGLVRAAQAAFYAEGGGCMNVEKKTGLRAWRWRQEFEPGRLGWLVNPFYFARQGLLAGLKEFFPQLRGEVLDVGCGSKPYRAMIPATRYVGLEYDTPRARASFAADAYYDGRTFPFADGSFDAVLCSQVFEHVFTPEEFLREIHRVLRPGGVLVLTVPFVWDEHEQPHDFARYSSFGLKALLERAGFVVEAQRKSTADSRVLAQLLNAYFYKITHGENRALNWLAMLGLMAPVNFLGIVLGRVLPGNDDLYLDNIVLARKRSSAGGVPASGSPTERTEG